ncbi:hypothetical protein MRX96_051360 [Rhipicephalus microplus]
MQYDDAANSTLTLVAHPIDFLKTSATAAASTTSAVGARPYEGALSGHERLPQRQFAALLHKWELLRFGGTVTKWQSFWAVFLHSARENPRLFNRD